jgi:hypothetical protein
LRAVGLGCGRWLLAVRFYASTTPSALLHCSLAELTIARTGSPRTESIYATIESHCAPEAKPKVGSRLALALAKGTGAAGSTGWRLARPLPCRLYARASRRSGARVAADALHLSTISPQAEPFPPSSLPHPPTIPNGVRVHTKTRAQHPTVAIPWTSSQLFARPHLTPLALRSLARFAESRPLLCTPFDSVLAARPN